MTGAQRLRPLVDSTIIVEVKPCTQDKVGFGNLLLLSLGKNRFGVSLRTPPLGSGVCPAQSRSANYRQSRRTGKPSDASAPVFEGPTQLKKILRSRLWVRRLG